jgi:hypothetical protein
LSEVSDSGWLEDIAIPIAAVIVSAVIGFWGFFQARWRKRYFERLIKSELREIRPTKEDMKIDGKLESHLRKDFMHRKILENAEQNPELIFSIDPHLLYNVSQLWDAFRKNDANRWLRYLGILAFHPNDRPYPGGERANKKPAYDKPKGCTDPKEGGEIREAFNGWLKVFKNYGCNPWPQSKFYFNHSHLRNEFKIV